MIRTRPLNENDSLLLEKWIVLDPDHSGKSKVSFWTEKDRANCFAVEDDIGTIFYVRAENVLRLHVQFAPPSEVERTRIALGSFLLHIQAVAKKTYRQIIYESVFKPLIRFTRKYGYHSSINEQLVSLD